MIDPVEYTPSGMERVYIPVTADDIKCCRSICKGLTLDQGGVGLSDIVASMILGK